MQKKLWQTLIAIIGSIALYRLLVNFDFSMLNMLSLKTIQLLFCITLVFLAAEIIYLKILFMVSSIYVETRQLLFLYFSSHMIGTFTTYYIGLASFIILLKKVAQITYKQAATCSMLDLSVRYLLRLLLACAGTWFLFKGYYSAIIIIAAVSIFFIIIIFPRKLENIFTKTELSRRLWRYSVEIKQTIMSFSYKKILLMFVIAISSLLLESLVFLYLASALGSSCNFLLILGIRCLGLFIGYCAFVPAFNIIEDLGAISLWLLVGMDMNVAITATVISRIFITLLPLCISIVIVTLFFGNYRTLVRETYK